MRSRVWVLEALSFVLLEKIYPRKPALMRNDSLAASVVVQYVSTMLSEYQSSKKLNQNRTKFQKEARDAYYKIYPLENLTVATVRKYIAELWRDDSFLKRIKISKVKKKLL